MPIKSPKKLAIPADMENYWVTNFDKAQLPLLHRLMSILYHHKPSAGPYGIQGYWARDAVGFAIEKDGDPLDVLRVMGSFVRIKTEEIGFYWHNPTAGMPIDRYPIDDNDWKILSHSQLSVMSSSQLNEYLAAAFTMKSNKRRHGAIW